MTKLSYVDELKKDPELNRIYEEESLIVEATDLICILMEKENCSKADLAIKLNCSKAHVTRLLSGTRNMTVRTVASVLFALGYRANFKEEKIIKTLPVTSGVVLPFSLRKRPSPYNITCQERAMAA